MTSIVCTCCHRLFAKHPNAARQSYCSKRCRIRAKDRRRYRSSAVDPIPAGATS